MNAKNVIFVVLLLVLTVKAVDECNPVTCFRYCIKAGFTNGKCVDEDCWCSLGSKKIEFVVLNKYIFINSFELKIVDIFS